MRDHNPILIEKFNGLWSRGDADSVPPDHFSDCNNVRFIESGFETRKGIAPYSTLNNVLFANILRMYTFVQETGQSVLFLNIYNQIFDSGSPTPTVPILTVIGMTDFGFVSISGRAFLTPSNGVTGLDNEFVYVYDGDGTVARKAAGVGPVNADGLLSAANSGAAGHVEAGIHIFAAVYETDSGFLTNFGPDTLPTVTAPGSEGVNLSNIPVSSNAAVTKVHIVATKAIFPSAYTGNTRGYQFFFVPDAFVTNGTTTLSVSFFDSELLEDASHLEDLFSEIPATVGLNTYHNRMTAWATHDDISICYISESGEPEAINQISGLIVVPLDGNPLTHCQEFRDILYTFKQTRTLAYNDNGDVPSSWPQTVLDQGIGCSVHGIAAVLDSGGVNIDYLIIIDYSGIMLFNGLYTRPELSWKIQDLWLALDRSLFSTMDIVNDSLNQKLYITLTDGSMLVGNYSNGLDPKNIRWSTWQFNMPVSSLTLINTNTLLLSSTFTVVEDAFAVFDELYDPIVYNSDLMYWVTYVGPDGASNYGRKLASGNFASLGAVGNLKIYDTNVNLLSTTVLGALLAPFLMTSNAKIYTLFRDASNNWTFQQRSNAGVIVKTVVAPAGTLINTIRCGAVTQNDTIFYFCGGSGVGIIKRYDIVNEVNLTDFVSVFTTVFDMMTLPNGDVIFASGDPIQDINLELYHYDSSGTLLHRLSGTRISKLSLSVDRSNTVFWARTNSNMIKYQLNTIGTGITVLETLGFLDAMNSFFIMDDITNATLFTGIYQLTVNETHDEIYSNLAISTATVDVMIPNPFIETYLSGDKEENILHYGAIKLRVNGSGNLIPTLIGFDDILTNELAVMPMSTVTAYEPVRLANFVSQRAKLRLETEEIDDVIRINRIILYAKKFFEEYPNT